MGQGRVMACSRKGDAKALEFWQEYGKYLGIGVTSLLYVLTPEAVLIGGGVSASFDFFLPSMKTEIEQRVMPTSRENLRIIRAQLGNGAGMLGAAKLALEKFVGQTLMGSGFLNSKIDNILPDVFGKLDAGVKLTWDKRPYDGKRERNIALAFDLNVRF